jgi:hypothetical protein
MLEVAQGPAVQKAWRWQGRPAGMRACEQGGHAAAAGRGSQGEGRQEGRQRKRVEKGQELLRCRCRCCSPPCPSILACRECDTVCRLARFDRLRPPLPPPLAQPLHIRPPGKTHETRIATGPRSPRLLSIGYWR